MTMRSILISFLLVASVQALAAETILFGSSSDAMTCYQAATAHPQSADVDSCTSAIREGNLSPSDLAATYSNRGIILANNGQIDKAIQDQTTAVQLDPLSARAHNNRANAYYRAKRHKEALEEYDQAISLSGGKLAPAYYNRAQLRKALGDKDNARKDMQQAAALAPDAYQQALDGFDRPDAGS
jgi:tetratricopeptide (TPR) repeat protein